MASQDDELTLEELDEQIDALARMPQSLPTDRQQTPSSQLIQHLSHLYPQEQATAHSVEAVWQRLVDRGTVPAEVPLPPSRSDQPRTLPIDVRPPQSTVPPNGRRQIIAARLMASAAAVLLVVAVSGLIAGLVLVRQHTSGREIQKTQTAIPATSCPTQPTARAEAWFPSGPDDQVMGTVNGGAVTTLSDFHYPLFDPQHKNYLQVPPVFMAWSPDARYLAVGFGVIAGSDLVYPYLVDTTTHATTALPSPTHSNGLAWQSWPDGHPFAWADDHTLLLFYGGNTAQGSSGPSYSYDLQTKKLTELPGVTNAAEGMVRCSTLFYLSLTPPTEKMGEDQGDGGVFYGGTAWLHRYDLRTQRDLGQPITLGPTELITSPGVQAGNALVPRWDVSADGTVLVYAQGTFASGLDGVTGAALILQQYMAANADGSQSRSLPNSSSAGWANTLRISPDKQSIAVISYNGIFSLSLKQAEYRHYGYKTAGMEDGIGDPVWLSDSSGFDAVTAPLQQGQLAVTRYLLQTSPGTDGFVPGTTLVDAPIIAGLS